MPPIPGSPERFEAHRPKVVVHYALGRLLNWVSVGGWNDPADGHTPVQRDAGRIADCDVIPGATQSPGKISQRAASPEEILPLLLGVLVDLLILLSVLAVGPERRVVVS